MLIVDFMGVVRGFRGPKGDDDSNFSIFRGGSLNGPDLFTKLPFL